jgi:excisionase family DNA binding protein
MAKTAKVDNRGLTEERLLTPEQVAQRLQLSQITIIHWLRAKKLPGVKLGGKLWRARESDLLHFIAALSTGQTPR